MLNTAVRTWLIGSWVTALVVIIVVSVAMGANLSTLLLVLALGVAPGVVMAMLRSSAASPTVAEILHTAHTTDDRS